MRWTDDDTNSIKMLIKNKGICFGTQDKVINCNHCILFDNCASGIGDGEYKKGDLFYQRYLLAVSIAQDRFNEAELFKLLL